MIAIFAIVFLPFQNDVSSVPALRAPPVPGFKCAKMKRALALDVPGYPRGDAVDQHNDTLRHAKFQSAS
jgi:hypothetical protein